MTDIYVASDHHFGHRNILNFTRKDGTLIRGAVFSSSEEHDEMIIQYHNEIVRPQDHVYFLGDFAIKKPMVAYASRMNGHKRLVRGNHDIAKTKDYIKAGFEEIYGVRVWPKQGFIFSHVPLHPASLSSRNWVNVHGHTHENLVLREDGTPDERYTCVSLEHTNYRPILLMR